MAGTFLYIFFFFFILALFSKQERTGSLPLSSPGTLYDTISSLGFPRNMHSPWLETQEWLRDTSKIFIQTTSFCQVLTQSRAHAQPQEHLSHCLDCAFSTAPNSSSAWLFTQLIPLGFFPGEDPRAMGQADISGNRVKQLILSGKGTQHTETGIFIAFKNVNF